MQSKSNEIATKFSLNMLVEWKEPSKVVVIKSLVFKEEKMGSRHKEI